MKLKIIRLSLVLILAAGFWLVLPTVFLNKEFSYIQDSKDYLAEIKPGQVKEIFLQQPLKDIYKIELLLKNPGLSNSEDLIIDISTNKNSQTYSYKSSNVGDPSWLPLLFKDPQTNSLKIKLSNPGKNSNSLFWYSKNDTEPSVRIQIKPTLNARFSKSIQNAIGWVETTSKTHLVVFLFILLTLCFI